MSKEVIIYDLVSLKVILMICFILELFHIILVHCFIAPNKNVVDMKVELAGVERELKSIKSVQVQFTQHSKLSRKKLKNENKIKNIEEAEIPYKSLVVNIFNYLKITTYIGIYFTFPTDVGEVMKISSDLFWPLFGGSYWLISEWQLLFLCQIATRYSLRAILPAILTSIVLG